MVIVQVKLGFVWPMCICLHWISFVILSLSQFYEILVLLLTASLIFALNASETTIVSFHFTESGCAGRYAGWFIPHVFPVSETVLHGNTSFLIILFPPRHSVSLRTLSKRPFENPNWPDLPWSTHLLRPFKSYNRISMWLTSTKAAWTLPSTSQESF